MAKSPALRRDLGPLESYAALIGILVGAGIFKVTSDASAATGPSVIVAHLVLAPVILASSVAYVVFLSTRLGLEPGGEVLHVSRTFRSPALTFVCAWLKLISYIGAGAYLVDALAVNLLELFSPGSGSSPEARTATALASLAFFFCVHVLGVRWFGRLQVWMCAILGVSLVVLIVPGLFAVKLENYSPFFTGGLSGFGASLTPLFFAYAGFESLAHSAGEVRDSRSRLPRVFVRGILVTTVIFVSMSAVAFGVLPADALGSSEVPMSAAAATYLPFGAVHVVTIGAIMAVATSLNATMMVPARLAFNMAREGQLSPTFSHLHATRKTPDFGLIVSFGLVTLLLVSGQFGLAVGIAVVSLMLLYALHSLALILLPRRNPELYAEVTATVPRGVQLVAAWSSVLVLGAIITIRFIGDLDRIRTSPFVDRVMAFDLTSLELLVIWVTLGLTVYSVRPRKRHGRE